LTAAEELVETNNFSKWEGSTLWNHILLQNLHQLRRARKMRTTFGCAAPL
jgi:hypothetical protein